jgi:hypothetical protein
VRLHVEQFEARLFMNGDDPAGAEAALISGAATNLDTNTTNSATAIDSTASSPVTTSTSLPEHFQTLADFEAWLIEAAIAEYGHLFGQPTL